MPYYPENSGEKGIPYDINSYWESMTAKYLNCSVFDVLNLDYVDFLFYRRDAFIAELSKTDAGREYLEKAKAFESEEADYEGMRRFQKKMMRR